jgi:LmbE family N-acetylglucosaminyl deacetylase
MDNILVVSAHPDDMEIGMGGTVAKLADSSSVCSIILTDGRRSPNPFSWTEDQIAEIRRKEAKSAGTVLHVNEIIFCNLSDLKQESNFRIARRKIKEVIQEQHPSEIFTLHPHLDRHASHRLAAKATLEGLSELKPSWAPWIWAYEVWGLFHEWDRIEDISNHIGRKRMAIEEHRSQIAAFSFSEAVAGLNRWRAVFSDPQAEGSKTAFAEVFIKLDSSSR